MIAYCLMMMLLLMMDGDGYTPGYFFQELGAPTRTRKNGVKIEAAPNQGAAHGAAAGLLQGPDDHPPVERAPQREDRLPRDGARGEGRGAEHNGLKCWNETRELCVIWI